MCCFNVRVLPSVSNSCGRLQTLETRLDGKSLSHDMRNPEGLMAVTGGEILSFEFNRCEEPQLGVDRSTQGFIVGPEIRSHWGTESQALESLDFYDIFDIRMRHHQSNLDFLSNT